MPLIIAGDMNSDRLDSYAELATRVTAKYQLTDVGLHEHQETTPTYFQHHASLFDYIFVRNLQITSYSVPRVTKPILSEESGSDHLPVTAGLTL